MIHYPTECSSLPILSFFACPSDSEFSGISKNPRDLLKVIFSLEKPLRERNHVNCAPSPLCPVHSSLKVIFQSQKFFSTPVVHIFSLIYAKKYEVYYHHCYSPSCSWEAGRKEKKSISGFCA